MSAKLLLGKPVVDAIRQTVTRETCNLDKKLWIIGFDEPCWNQYSESLKKSASNYGIECCNAVIDYNIAPRELCKLLDELCVRDDIGGVMLQQPLDKKYSAALEHIDPNKDVDCLNPLSVYRMYNGEIGLRPATPQAVIRLLEYYQIDLKGKNVAIVGRGNAVGKPLALMMLQRNATVTVCHTKTIDLPSICRRADIIVSACGVAGLIANDYVSERSIVIDVGLSFVDGKTRGDVSADAMEKCYAVSPVPGGVGPITRAVLFENMLKASKGIK